MSAISPEAYERRDGRWGWRLVARNGEIVAVDGGQGFRDRVDAERALDRMVDLVQGMATYPAPGDLGGE